MPYPTSFKIPLIIMGTRNACWLAAAEYLKNGEFPFVIELPDVFSGNLVKGTKKIISLQQKQYPKTNEESIELAHNFALDNGAGFIQDEVIELDCATDHPNVIVKTKYHAEYNGTTVIHAVV